jgi:hypothetical protein
VGNNADSCTVGRVRWVLRANGRQVPSKEIMWASLPSLAFIFFFLLFHLFSQLSSAREASAVPYFGARSGPNSPEARPDIEGSGQGQQLCGWPVTISRVVLQGQLFQWNIL